MAALEDTENHAFSDKQCQFYSVTPDSTTQHELASGDSAFWEHLTPFAPRYSCCVRCCVRSTHTHTHTGRKPPGSWRCLRRRHQPAAGASATSQPPHFACAPEQLDQGTALLLPLPPALPMSTGDSFQATTTEARSHVQLKHCDSEETDKTDFAVCYVLCRQGC